MAICVSVSPFLLCAYKPLELVSWSFSMNTHTKKMIIKVNVTMIAHACTRIYTHTHTIMRVTVYCFNDLGFRGM